MHHAAAGQTHVLPRTPVPTRCPYPQYCLLLQGACLCEVVPLLQKNSLVPVQIALLLGLEPLHLRHTITLALGCIVRLLVTY